MNAARTQPIDLNVLNATSDCWSVLNDSHCTIIPDISSGTWGLAVLTAEGSNDKSSWSSLGQTIIAPLQSPLFSTGGYMYVRVRVSTAAGVACYARITIVSIKVPNTTPISLASISNITGLQAALDAKRDVTSFSVHTAQVSVTCALLTANGSTVLSQSWLSGVTILLANIQGNQGLLDSAAGSCDIPTSGNVTVRVQRGLLTPPSRTYVVNVIGINVPGI